MASRAGDAAHAFPPTGGLGLNTGLADVHNLAYKIAAAYHGWASDGLLDTYQADRRHIANVNALQSIKNGKRIFGLLRASGTATGDVEEARQNFALALKDPKRRAWIDEEIELQQEHFDNVSQFRTLPRRRSLTANSSNSTLAMYTAQQTFLHMPRTIRRSLSGAHDYHMSGSSQARVSPNPFLQPLTFATYQKWSRMLDNADSTLSSIFAHAAPSLLLVPRIHPSSKRTLPHSIFWASRGFPSTF